MRKDPTLTWTHDPATDDYVRSDGARIEKERLRRVADEQPALKQMPRAVFEEYLDLLWDGRPHATESK